jgi:hypothetical protein
VGCSERQTQFSARTLVRHRRSRGESQAAISLESCLYSGQRVGKNILCTRCSDLKIFLAKTEKGRSGTAIMRTSDLCLRLLRGVGLGEYSRGDDGNSGEELKRS